jgi:hypothetical protein
MIMAERSQDMGQALFEKIGCHMAEKVRYKLEISSR